MAVVKKSLPDRSKMPEKKPKNKPVVEDDFALPTVMSSPASHIGDYTMLLFGAKKIGKTTLAAMFPDALFLFTEPGGKSLRVYPLTIDSWGKFKKTIKALKKDKRFKTVVVDTVDRLFKLCWDAMLFEMDIDHPSDESWGKGWAKIRDEFDKEVTKLLSLEKGIIFTSHEAEKEIETRSGKKYHKLMPSMSNQARESIEALVDIWAHYDYDGDRRVLRVRGNDHIAAGHRLTENFRTPAGVDIEEIEMGTRVEDGYKNLMLAFNNQYTPPVRRKTELQPAPKTVVKKKVKV